MTFSNRIFTTFSANLVKTVFDEMSQYDLYDKSSTCTPLLFYLHLLEHRLNVVLTLLKKSLFKCLSIQRNESQFLYSDHHHEATQEV